MPLKAGPGPDPETIAVPSQDSADNNYVQDVVGNKTDTTSGDSLIALSKVNAGKIDGVETKVDTSIAGIVVVETKVDTSIAGIVVVDGKVDTAITDIGTVDGKIYTVAVPTADSVANAYIQDAVGNKADTVAGNSLISLIKILTAVVPPYPELGQNKATNALTFNNDTGTVSLFTVTGDVRVNIIAICKTNLASGAAGNIRLGVVGNTNAMISDILATDLGINEFWNDQSPTDVIQVKDKVRGYDISGGANVILTLDAQIDSGAITFYCYWSAHSGDGNVVSA